MNRVISMLIMGPLMALFPIIIAFIGVKHNYFDALGITVFFNHIFFTSFPTLLFSVLALIFALSFVLLKKMHVATVLTSVTLLVSMTTLIPSIGKELGAYMYEKRPFHIKQGHFLYKGVLQYESVNYYFLFDSDANRTIKFVKGDVLEAY